MEFLTRTVNQFSYLMCPVNGYSIQSEADVLDLLALCGEYDSNRVLVRRLNLPPEFFDLKTGFAGMFFQKMANYRVRWAVLLSENTDYRERFKELMFEHATNRTLRFSERQSDSETWLAQ